MNETIKQQSEALRPHMSSLQTRALIVGVIGLAATAFGYVSNQEQFFRSYLISFTFWLSLSIGCLGILMLHHLVGGRWGFTIRRFLEAGSRTFILMLILFLPLLLGLHSLYVWTHADVVAADELLQHKAFYLNVPFFTIRAFVYFAIWILLSFLLSSWSRAQDNSKETHYTRRMQLISGPGMVVLFLTGTLAIIDWVMSLEPHWYSTMYGIIYIVGGGLFTWAFMILVSTNLANREPFNHIMTNQTQKDLGTFMLACVMLWAYTSFSQFLIIWSGNLPEEVTWYMNRLDGGWLDIGVLLIAFHFALPFVLLVSSRLKARTKILVTIALGLIVMRYVDIYWITAPAFHHAHFSWMDLSAPVGIGGIWVAFFFSQLKTRSLIALNDPRFEDLLSGEDGHHHG
jgi:hypothetical protein